MPSSALPGNAVNVVLNAGVVSLEVFNAWLARYACASCDNSMRCREICFDSVEFAAAVNVRESFETICLTCTVAGMVPEILTFDVEAITVVLAINPIIAEAETLMYFIQKTPRFSKLSKTF